MKDKSLQRIWQNITTKKNTECINTNRAADNHAPRPRMLTRSETTATFEDWKHSLTSTLSSDPMFALFLCDGVKWTKKSKANATRGFVDDTDVVSLGKRLTAAQKVIFLELMLEQIATYAPTIARSTIIRNSTSTASVWQTIRQHYGLHNAENHFNQASNIVRHYVNQSDATSVTSSDKRHEAWFQPSAPSTDEDILSHNESIPYHELNRVSVSQTSDHITCRSKYISESTQYSTGAKLGATMNRCGEDEEEEKEECSEQTVMDSTANRMYPYRQLDPLTLPPNAQGPSVHISTPECSTLAHRPSLSRYQEQSENDIMYNDTLLDNGGYVMNNYKLEQSENDVRDDNVPQQTSNMNNNGTLDNVDALMGSAVLGTTDDLSGKTKLVRKLPWT